MVPRTDTRLGFWREYRQRIPEPRAPDTRSDEDFIRQKENVLRRRFPRDLEIGLSRHWGYEFRRDRDHEGPAIEKSGSFVTVIIKNISYGSLVLDFDVITAPLVALGLTSDDLLSLLERYTPEMIEFSLDRDINLDVKVAGAAAQTDDPQLVATSSTLTHDTASSIPNREALLDRRTHGSTGF
jgi:hypothetical protein